LKKFIHFFNHICSGLARAGMSIARLNFSHATHEFAQEIVTNIQKARELTKKNIAILGDLRVGRENFPLFFRT